MSVIPPEDKIWWRNPIDKGERLWLMIAIAWAIILFLMMPMWHVVGTQNPSAETYKISPDQYNEKVQEFIDKNEVEAEGGTVAEPTVDINPSTPQMDVYIKAQRYSFYPVLRLKEGKTYRLHLSSMDVQHGFSLYPMTTNFQIIPGYEYVVTVTPTEAREYHIICNEYCGMLHHSMVGRLEVVQ